MSARSCKYCGNGYIQPCDGKDKTCGNYAHATKVRAARKKKAKANESSSDSA